MIGTRGLIATTGIAIATGILVGPPVTGAVGTTIQIRQSDLLSDVAVVGKSGHFAFTKDGLHVWTSDASAAAVVRQYFPISGSLANMIGSSSTWYGLPPAPSSRIMFDVDSTAGNGNDDNELVSDADDSTDWWLTESSSVTAQDACPTKDPGSGSACHGTLAQWDVALPEARVHAGGFSLGPDVQADGVLVSQKFGSTMYRFTSLPSALTGLRASDFTRTGFRLRWDPAAGATSYAVRVGGRSVSATNTSVTLTGLRPNVPYLVSVTPRNTAGSGPRAAIVAQTLPGKPTTRMTMRVAPAKVRHGSLATLSGSLRANDAAASGVKVTIARRTPHGWHMIKRVHTATDGSWATLYRARRPASLRAKALGYPAVYRQVRVTPLIKIAAVAPDGSALRAVVRPHLTGARVRLRSFGAVGWATLRHSRLPARGAVTYRHLPAGTYRVIVKPSHGFARGISPQLILSG